MTVHAPDAATHDAAVAAFRDAIVDKLAYAVGKDREAARDHDWFVATALAARDRSVDRWMETTRRTRDQGSKRTYYLSLEFLIGRLLFDTLGNLGLTETAREALAQLGVDLDRIRAIEPDAALGNGGLGRLAACFMESMATPTATASATISASSARSSPTAGSRSCRRIGSPSAIRGSSSVPRSSTRSASAAASSKRSVRTARPGRCGSRPTACWPPPTTRPWSAGAGAG